ncbi:MAG: hypothetical protein U9N38_06905, partial [Thermodesulfobacteriota bacterium]|nr:hypothetical protein [Thermodesulfobacteriota bacterium]
REWAASDGDESYSPIAQVEIIEDGGRRRFSLDEVLVDDRPLDKESNEDVSWSGLFAKSKESIVFR